MFLFVVVVSTDNEPTSLFTGASVQSNSLESADIDTFGALEAAADRALGVWEGANAENTSASASAGVKRKRSAELSAAEREKAAWNAEFDRGRTKKVRAKKAAAIFRRAENPYQQQAKVKVQKQQQLVRQAVYCLIW